MSDTLSADMSNLSIASSSSSHIEDWDSSFASSSNASSTAASPRHRTVALPGSGADATTPRNSVAFPGEGGDVHATPGGEGKRGKRSLSELLRLHAEKGTDVKFSAEEAARIAEVLNNWINAGTSPYEDEDDFFARSSQDDSSPSLLQGQRSVSGSRPRGQSEGGGLSRPTSASGPVKA